MCGSVRPYVLCTLPSNYACVPVSFYAQATIQIIQTSLQQQCAAAMLTGAELLEFRAVLEPLLPASLKIINCLVLCCKGDGHMKEPNINISIVGN